MSCYFMIDTYIDIESGRGQYDDYIAKVKPIVESYGGTIRVVPPITNYNTTIQIKIPKNK